MNKKTNDSTNNSPERGRWFWWNWGLTFIAVAYLVWHLFPLWNNFFIFDDMGFLDLGPQLKKNPFAWVTYTYFGWWRPIGFTLPGLFYLFFRMHPFPYHIAGILIHLLATGALYSFCRRFLTLQGAFYSSLLFFISPVFISAFTFISIVCEDELSAVFLFVALAGAWRLGRSQGQPARLYWLSGFTLLAAAACKDSWIGLIPAFIMLDCLNYKQSPIWMRGLRLLPLLMPISISVGRLLILGWSDVSRMTAWYIENYFNTDNLIWGATLPFLPFTVMEFGLWQQVLRSAYLLFILILSLWIAKEHRQIVGLLWLAFGGLLMALGSTVLDNSFWGWMHLPPLIGLAAVIYAITLRSLLLRWHLSDSWWLLCFMLPLVWIVLQRPVFSDLKQTLVIDGYKNKRGAYGLLKIGKTLPPGSKVYAFFGFPRELVLGEMLPSGFDYTEILVKTKTWVRKRTTEIIIGSPAQLRVWLAKDFNDPHVVFLVHDDDYNWREVTGDVKSWLQGSDDAVPPEIKIFLDYEKAKD